jgi:hypothetical protein
MRAVLVLVLLAAVALGAYLIVDSSSGGGQVQLNEQIKGDVDQAVQAIQDLIADNTR